jgi:hypothetical protein
MASGLSGTFRIGGVALGVAALGALFQNQVQSKVVEALTGTPLAPHSGRLADALASGNAPAALGSVPAGQRGLLAQAAESSFVSGLHSIMLLAAIACFVGAALSAVLVRQRDFVEQPAGEAVAAAA